MFYTEVGISKGSVATLFFLPRGGPSGKQIDVVLEARQAGPKTFRLRILTPERVDIEAFRKIVDRVRSCLGSSDMMNVDESSQTFEITTDYAEVRQRCLYNEGISVSSVEEEKVVLNEVQVAPEAYEITIHTITELPDYEEALRKTSECVNAEDRAYVATNWSTKRNCLILASTRVDSFTQCLSQKGLSVETTALKFPLTELSHEFINSRSEFEFLMDDLTKCKNEDDRPYLAHDPSRNLNCILLASRDMNALRTCLATASIQLVPKQS